MWQPRPIVCLSQYVDTVLLIHYKQHVSMRYLWTYVSMYQHIHHVSQYSCGFVDIAGLQIFDEIYAYIFSHSLLLSQTLSLGTLVCNLPHSFCCCYCRLFCVPLWWSCGDEDRHDEHLLSVGTATCWLFVVIVSSIFLFTQFCRLFFCVPEMPGIRYSYCSCIAKSTYRVFMNV